MSASLAIQAAIYQTLIADADVSAIVGDRVFDGRPDDAEYPNITFGPADYDRRDDVQECVQGRVETVQVDCWVRDGRRLNPVKVLSDRVSRALHLAKLDVSPYHLVEVRADSVRAFMDPDGLTGHGIVTVQVEIDGEGD